MSKSGKRFFIERLTKDGIPSSMVDEVDEFVFDNRKNIVNRDGAPRYSPSHMVLFNDSTFEIDFVGSTRLFTHFTRLTGASTNVSGTTDFCTEPEAVIIGGNGSRKPILYSIVDQTKWKMV